jgi:hypothetical protein
MAGKRVNIARWSAGRWVTFQTATLQAIARTPTTSDVYVNTLVRRGTKLRVFLPADQVGPNYLDGHSNYIIS